MNGARGDATSGRVAPPSWRAPHLLLSAMFALGAVVFALRAGPPEPNAGVTSSVRFGSASVDEARDREVTLFVEEGAVVRTMRRRVTATGEASADAQAVVDALHEALASAGTWPEGWSAPSITVFDLDRDTVAVLDLTTPPQGEIRPSVDAERRIVASFAATLDDVGIDRVAYLVDGRPTGTWFGLVAVPSTLD